MTAAAHVGRSTLRVLIVTYYFPPSGGAGVQRPLKWVKYLLDHDVEPVVLTVRNGAFPQIDDSLLDDVPASVSVIRTGSIDPFAAYARLTGRSRAEAISARTDVVGHEATPLERVARWLRANVFVPDARAGWVPFAVASGRSLARRRRIDAVVSTGPPHSAHLVGMALKGAQRPWLADFRDPWTDIHYYDGLPRTAIPARLDAALERRVLRAADAVTTVSPSWARLLHYKRADEVGVIQNGFDPEDFSGPEPEKSPDVFTVAHVGSLYASRNPVALWKAVARLRGAGRVPALRVLVVGRVGEEVLRSAARRGIPLETTGYLPHAQAVREMRSAHVVLLSTERHAAEAGHITGKLYEYLASATPVLGLGYPRGDAADVITSTGAGRMFARDDQEGVARFLLKVYGAWERGEHLRGADPRSIQQFSRERQAAHLADLLRTMTARRRR